ncbi:DNA-binding transcriptional regulator OxyR [Haematobacter massiliensis]|uniref:LysR family transcriptional regulator n=1 Tax=Haematobacter massiliensis TaxID=195105 RepID=A0A086Y4S2_9RHOB|nr:hydrogen peroxide-inducible genes activator [Haematobacter massiliensis]KFI29272.1 LysR family transcriptional regulator [Haematobacter massiliensis]OWJ69924.1 DNA-binding transcriptional regulator OxyR [Haematobacter massiliensis]OWJ82654.1 DNA-binding transcriptional regulator OxyR [Haematobacter massiliensis]QBJ25886.1 hydrogen peroxide-inducible genes activator [Haematobacter massiliensis]
MPTLQQLRYLVAVADTLSFSRAAEMCRVTQPTLSMQLRELEARLGARLVERTRAHVLMTPVGEAVARRARAVMAEIDDMREIARRDDPEAPQAALRLGVVQTVGAYVLSVAMPALRRTFPRLRLQVREERFDMLLRQILDGAHDAILLPEAVERPDLESRLLAVEPLQVVLPADHRLTMQPVLQPADLAGETVLTMEGSAELQAQVTRLCTMAGAAQARDYEGTTLDTLRQMVAAGMGLSLLPTLYIRSEVMREQLVVARPLATDAPTRALTMAWRRDTPRARTHAALAALLSENLAQLPGMDG